MANYFLQNDGSITNKRKKKGRNYILEDNGNLRLSNPLPTKQDVKEEKMPKFGAKDIFNAITNPIGTYNKAVMKAIPDEKVKKVTNFANDVMDNANRQLMFNGNLPRIADKGLPGRVSRFKATLGGNAVKGARSVEAAGLKLIGKENAIPDETVSEKEAYLAQRQAKGIEKPILDITGSIGRMAPQIAASVINPALGTPIGFANYGGGAYDEAKKEGYDENSATLYGTTIGALEIGLEKVLGGFESIYGKTKAGEFTHSVVDKVIPKIIKNKTVRGILAQAGGEGLEEFIQEYTENIAKETILEKKDFWKSTMDNVKSKENLENALYSGLIGAITSGLIETPAAIANKRVLDTNIPKQNVEEQVEQEVPIEETIEKEQQQPIVNIKDAINENLYQYQPVENQNINEMNESIKKYFNNSQETHEMADNISKIIADKDYKATGTRTNFKDIRQVIEDSKNKPLSKEVKLNLNKDEQNELNALKALDEITDLDKKDLERMKYLENKGKNLIKFPELSTETTYQDIKNKYSKYKDLSNFDSKLLNNAESLVSGYRNTGKRTKEQWLDVARYMGERFKGNSSQELEKYAIQSWHKANPNYKGNLNRQGKSFVPFKIDEWINAMYKGAGVGEILEKPIEVKQEKANLPTKPTKKVDNLPIKEEKVSKKELNPTEIANLTEEYANTTPILPTKKSVEGNKKSGFAKNINNIDVLSEETKKTLLSDKEVTTYNKVTNEQSLETAKQRLDKNGKEETMRWLGKDNKKADSTDVAEGWILLEQYQDKIKNTKDKAQKDALNKSMVEIAKKQRNILTNAGQTIQAASIMQRMTPEGMVYYAQSELSEAFDRIKKDKTQKWIDKNAKDFELTPEETEFIMKNMKEASETTDAYVKKVKLAEIQKLMSNKLPAKLSDSVKAWMRISMLFNPKTQVRNILGNAVILPTNIVGDKISSAVDKMLSKKTGVRTRGSSMKGYFGNLKGGVKEAVSEGKKGISTRDITGNRFEFGEGKSFNDNTAVGRALNKVDNKLGMYLDAGDRGFYKAEFEKSLNNLMKLNGVDEPTPEMIEIASKDADSRTWQDSNAYTKTVLSIRSALNLNKSTGFGDVLIPFAKTPANLTKAIIDYSPVGLINTAIKGYKLNNSLSNGQFNMKTQHEFVDTLGKAAAGSLLYIIGAALAKAGISTGENDKDKDVSNFMRNILGISPYSIKVGNKSFKYDWAQPVAAPFAITANMEQKNKENASIIEKVLSTADTGLNVLFEQSFLESMKDLLSRPGEIGTKIGEQILDLPSRAIPTLFKQIADMVDPTQRTTFEYGKPLETAKNKVKSKIPFVSKSLPKMVDTLGRDIEKYGGENNLYNVFLNPANVNKGKLSESGKEIYRLYKELGDKTIMPRVAPYYINNKGEKINLSSKEKARYQKISGGIIEKEVGNLLKNDVYKNASDEEKQDIIKNIIDYSYNRAKSVVTDLPMSNTYNKATMYVGDGGKLSDYYTHKQEIDYSYTNPSKYQAIRQIEPYDDYLVHNKKINDIRDNSNDKNRKYNVINYVNGLNLSIPKKAMMIKFYYKSFRDYDSDIIEYVNKQNMTAKDKGEILKQFGFKVENGRVYR